VIALLHFIRVFILFVKPHADETDATDGISRLSSFLELSPHFCDILDSLRYPFTQRDPDRNSPATGIPLSQLSTSESFLLKDPLLLQDLSDDEMVPNISTGSAPQPTPALDNTSPHRGPAYHLRGPSQEPTASKRAKTVVPDDDDLVLPEAGSSRGGARATFSRSAKSTRGPPAPKR
jgi:hypothetical protein